MAKSKRNSMKLKPVMLLVIGVLAVGIFILLINVTANSGKKDEEGRVNVSVNDANLAGVGEKATSHHEQSGKTTVEIQLSDCAVAVGSVFKVVALVTPYDTDKSIVWATNNSEVLDVTTDGVVTVKSTGMATVSATVGDITDAVVIEGIKEIASGSSNGFPVYTVSAVTGVSGNTGSAGSSGGTGGTGSTGSAGSTGNSGNGGSSQGSNTDWNGTGSAGSSGGTGGTGSAGSTGNSGNGGSGQGSNTDWSGTGSTGGSGGTGGTGSTGSAGSTGNSGNGGNSQGGNTGWSGTGSTGSSGGTGGTGSTGSAGSTGNSGSSEGLLSSQIGEQLGNIGFSQTYSNVYVCRDSEKYYGEIITQPDVTIIYIKERCDYFDSRIKSVISSLLPKQNEQVWNNYISASTDRTFTVEDRKVRIVVAANGGHSQIVIYN